MPGDRIQMDVCKIAPGRYQYTAIDNCTRYKVLALYPRRSANNSLKFLDKVMEEMPFALQRVQTDREREFFAQGFQERLMEYDIKFRPTKPATLVEQLQEWQHYYNWERPHGSLNGTTPIDKLCELIDVTPEWEETGASYNASKERILKQNYRVDLVLRKLKGRVYESHKYASVTYPEFSQYLTVVKIMFITLQAGGFEWK